MTTIQISALDFVVYHFCSSDSHASCSLIELQRIPFRFHGSECISGSPGIRAIHNLIIYLCSSLFGMSESTGPFRDGKVRKHCQYVSSARYFAQSNIFF